MSSDSAVPTTFLENIPLVGRFFNNSNASEDRYSVKAVMEPNLKNWGRTKMPRSEYDALQNERRIVESRRNRTLGNGIRQFGERMTAYRFNAYPDTGGQQARGDAFETTLETTKGLFKSNITDSDREYLYRRDEIVHEGIDKFAGALVNKWFKIKLVHPSKKNKKFVKRLEKLHRDIRLRKYLKEAIIRSFVFGAAWISVAYDDMSAGLKVEPIKAKDVSYLKTIDKRIISVAFYDTNPTSKHYGKPLLYRLGDGFVRRLFKTDLIHRDRVLHLVMFPWGDELLGLSIIDHIFDKATVKKRFDWAVGEAYFRYAVPLAEITTPDDDKAQQDADDNFGALGVQGMYSWIHAFEPDDNGNDQWKLQLHGGKGTILNPMDFYDVIIEPMLAGLRTPKPLIMGSKGSAQGNQTNLENFYSEASNLQNTTLSDFIRDFHATLEHAGLFKYWGFNEVPEYEFEWNPIFELTPKEAIQNELMKARTNEIYSWKKGIGAKSIEEIRDSINEGKYSEEELAYEMKIQDMLKGGTGTQEDPGTNPDDPNAPPDKETSTKVPFQTHQIADDAEAKDQALLDALMSGDNDRLDEALLST